MKCKCVEKVNARMADKNLALKLHHTIHMETMDLNAELAIETVSLKKGVKATPCFMPFCPFCGKKNN